MHKLLTVYKGDNSVCCNNTSEYNDQKGHSFLKEGWDKEGIREQGSNSRGVNSNSHLQAMIFEVRYDNEAIKKMLYFCDSIEALPVFAFVNVFSNQEVFPSSRCRHS